MDFKLVIDLLTPSKKPLHIATFSSTVPQPPPSTPWQSNLPPPLGAPIQPYNQQYNHSFNPPTLNPSNPPYLPPHDPRYDRGPGFGCHGDGTWRRRNRSGGCYGGSIFDGLTNGCHSINRSFDNLCHSNFGDTCNNDFLSPHHGRYGNSHHNDFMPSHHHGHHGNSRRNDFLPLDTGFSSFTSNYNGPGASVFPKPKTQKLYPEQG